MASLPRALQVLLLILPAGATAFGLPKRVATPAKPTVEDAPPLWQTATCPNTGRTYYWNTETRETTWSRPAELGAASPPTPLADPQPVLAQTPLPAITWSGPSQSFLSRMATGTRASLAQSWSAVGAARTRLMQTAHATDARADAALAKGLCLGGTLAFAAAVFYPFPLVGPCVAFGIGAAA